MTGSGRSRKGKGRKMRGGSFYGFDVDPVIGSAGAKWGGVENLPVDKSGNPIPEAVMTGVTGGRRRRTSKKGRKSRMSRKGRRVHRRRTMRGGAGVMNAAGVGWGFAGNGIAGGITPQAYATRTGGAPTNADGVRSA